MTWASVAASIYAADGDWRAQRRKGPTNWWHRREDISIRVTTQDRGQEAIIVTSWTSQRDPETRIGYTVIIIDFVSELETAKRLVLGESKNRRWRTKTEIGYGGHQCRSYLQQPPQHYGSPKRWTLLDWHRCRNLRISCKVTSTTFTDRLQIVRSKRQYNNGEKTLQLNLGLRWNYIWTFVVADVSARGSSMTMEESLHIRFEKCREYVKNHVWFWNKWFL